MTTLNLTDLKPLTTEQYDRARDAALERMKKRIGDKPNRKQFERDLGRLWTVLDVIAAGVFIPALIVSSAHIIVHMGKLAEQSYTIQQASAGTVLGQDLFVSLHQWMLIPLAEGSMILFVVMFGLTRDSWRRWVYLALAALAVIFVLVANWQSGIGLLESLLPPAFTIGIGLKLEHLIVQSLRRRREVDEQYVQALETWEAATQDATQHPDYPSILKQEIWQSLTKLKANLAFVEAPTAFKVAAVRREMERDSWAKNEVEPIATFNQEGQVEKATASSPFGSSAPALVEAASMPVIVSANGHGGVRPTEN